MAYKSIEKQRAFARAYREKNKEKLKLKKKEYYQKNREKELQRSRSYAQKNITRIKEYHKEYYVKIKLEVFARIDPAMKCAMCGCGDIRLLEINHIKGGGNKEQQRLKKTDHNLSQNFIMLIHNGKRGTEDLNLLCRVCNSIDHLERAYGNTGLRVVWDKQVTNLTVI